MTNLEAAVWATAYADELEQGGWTEDAVRYRVEARRLTEVSPAPAPNPPEDCIIWPDSRKP